MRTAFSSDRQTGPRMKHAAPFGMVFLLILCMSFAGCRKTDDAPDALLFEKPADSVEKQDVCTIYLTHSADENSFTHQAAKIFKETLETESGGRFSVRIFPNDIFGTVSEADHTLQNGSVQMRIGSGPCTIIWMISYRFLSGMDLPELRKALEEESLLGLINEEGAAYGVRVLGILPSSYRVMTSNIPIRKAEDLQGMTLRMYDAENPIRYWTAQGAEVKIFPFSEVYGALQSGLVDGNPEVTLQDILTRRLYEQQKYVIDIRQQIYHEAVYVNLDFYESLTEEDRDLLDRCVHSMVRECEPVLEKILADAKEVLADAGVEWLEIPEEEQKKIMQRGEEVMVPALKQQLGEETWNRLTETLRRIRENKPQ